MAISRSLFLFVVLIWAACAPSQTSQPAKANLAHVVRVIDGDTIVVIYRGGEERIRLEGIDTPERGQPYFEEATEALANLVDGRKVTLRGDERDRYGRIIARVIVGETDTSKELLRLGMAWHYKKYNQQENLAEIEMQAQAGKVGLWGADAPIPPWDFRKR